MASRSRSHLPRPAPRQESSRRDVEQLGQFDHLHLGERPAAVHDGGDGGLGNAGPLPQRRLAEPAIIFPDRHCEDEWRVEWIDDDGRVEVAIFAGPKTRERAIRYADRQYGLIEEVSLGG